MDVLKKAHQLETRDYQNRKGAYPKSNIPDAIYVVDAGPDFVEIEFEFKSTTEKMANTWAGRYLRSKLGNLPMQSQTYQAGDYQDDWVHVAVRISL